MSKVKELTGQRFGRLTVIRRSGATPQRLATWLCRCDCGNECVVSRTCLVDGYTKSCGCLNIEAVKARRTTHKKFNTRLYWVWANMIQRCSNPKHNSYHRYGGRGITVCDQWRYSFQAFYDWAMTAGYDENAPRGQCTIDRIDNDKGYSPDNCRWVNMATQSRNKSNNQKGVKFDR